MTIFILDSHGDDFIHHPISFYLAGRRALRKYKYFSDLPCVEYLSSGLVSSMPAFLQNRLPKMLMRVIVFFEVFIWRAINKVVISSEVAFKHDDVVLFFGYKAVSRKLDFLVQCQFKGRVIIHLSHYHVFDIDEFYFGKLDVTLAFDTDICEHSYFKKKYPNYSKDLMILPFCVSDAFFVGSIADKMENINFAVTGSYHEFGLGVLPFAVDDRSTLHPDRLRLSRVTLPLNVVNCLSKFSSSSSSLFGFIRRIFKASQRSYFKIDIVDVYRRSSYTFVGSEGNGAYGIGVIEAMAAGSVPILHISHKDDPVFASITTDVIWYTTFTELQEMIIRSSSWPVFYSSRNVQIAENFRARRLVDKLANQLC
jgi:glycosyltransferase involved in cell wall biosynthesis